MSCDKLRHFIQVLYDSGIVFPSVDLKSPNYKQQQDAADEECFLRGTFVFEDNSPENSAIPSVFNLLCGSRSWWKTTHQEARLKPKVLATWNRDKKVWFSEKDRRGHLKKLIHYETKMDPPLTYLCDKGCRKSTMKQKLRSCAEKKDVKRVVLIMCYKAENGKVYTLLKLEGHYSLHLSHQWRAVKRYQLKKETNPFYKTTRREDCKTKGKCTENKEPFFYANLKPEEIKDKEYYDSYIRTGQELWVPLSLTNILLKQ